MEFCSLEVVLILSLKINMIPGQRKLNLFLRKSFVRTIKEFISLFGVPVWAISCSISQLEVKLRIFLQPHLHGTKQLNYTLLIMNPDCLKMLIQISKQHFKQQIRVSMFIILESHLSIGKNTTLENSTTLLLIQLTMRIKKLCLQWRLNTIQSMEFSSIQKSLHIMLLH